MGLTDKGARAIVKRYFAEDPPPLIPQEIDDVMRWTAQALGIPAQPDDFKPQRTYD